MRRVIPAIIALGLAGCGSVPPRTSSPVVDFPAPHSRAALPSPPRSASVNACAPTRVHRDSDYTPGGLYAPGVADGGPAVAIDVSAVREPEPRAEPRARTGNRSPYVVLGKSYRVLETSEGYHERGVASWYGTKFNGRATSSGELYDMCVFSAAHKTLPLPSFVRVTNIDNGRSLVVRVNDRGPFHSGRIMDLSYAAAVRLGVDRTGTARVELQAIGPDGEPPRAARPARNNDVRISGVPLSRPQLQLADPADSERRSLVQVASFGERENARRLADRLRDAGIDRVDIDHTESDGRDLWRVRIGPVSGRDLPALLDRLAAMGLPNPRVFGQ